MSIRKSTIVIINILALVFLGIIVFITNIVIDRNFERLERANMIRKMDRLKESVEYYASDLETFTRDWATWDDTWNFVKTPSQAYLESNFTP
ncbi:MAG: CHASE4 domain-containing protein, partial [Candidatus Cloacimonadaceae bacterium]|nr:CHASE4 domain-containing protein [Candidatus Cloacimonadaceae bacterium]